MRLPYVMLSKAKHLLFPGADAKQILRSAPPPSASVLPQTDKGTLFKHPLIMGLIVLALSVTWTVCARAVDDKDTLRIVVPKPPKPPQVKIVHPEDGIPRAVVVEPGRVDFSYQSERKDFSPLTRDSIYAREITIDVGGIRIVDRDGKEILLPNTIVTGPEGLPEIVDIPEFDIVIQDESDTIYVRRGEPNDQVTQIASDIEVPADEVVRGDVICIFCDIDVKGRVTGSAVSVFGNVDVDGMVGDEAVAPFGRLRVGTDGSVRGDAVASRIVRDPGGRIGGSRQEIFFNLFGEGGLNESMTRHAFTILVVLKILFWLFLVLLAHALAARNVVKVKERIQRSYAKSFLMGVLGQILLLPVFLLLLVTIIGIPVALFVLPLMLFGGLVLAQAAVGQLVGDKVAENTAMPLHTPLSRTIFGVAALQIFAYLTIIFIWPAGGPAGGAFRIITLVMFVLSAILGYVVMTLGTGAVILTRFGTRPKEVAPVTTPEPTTGAPVLPEAGVTPLPFEPRRPGDEGAAPAPGM